MSLIWHDVCPDWVNTGTHLTLPLPDMAIFRDSVVFGDSQHYAERYTKLVLHQMQHQLNCDIEAYVLGFDPDALVVGILLKEEIQATMVALKWMTKK